MTNKSIRPEDMLSDSENYTVMRGVRVRKGTIGAALQNASILDSPSASQREKEEAKKVIAELAPGLVALGMYDHVVWKNKEIQKIVEEASKKI